MEFKKKGGRQGGEEGRTYQMRFGGIICGFHLNILYLTLNIMEKVKVGLYSPI